jgi:hypothetical protein
VSLFPAALAVIDVAGDLPTHPLLYSLRDRFLFFASLLAVVLCAIGWAMFIRKPSRRRRHHYRYPKAGDPASKPANDAGATTAPENNGKREHSRRRRRHSHPPATLNPTLAQTRGLPPIRTDSPPED